MGKLAEIYGNPDCFYCAQAMRLCESELNSEVKFYDINHVVNYVVLEKRLGGEVNYTPHIFIDGTHITGGFIQLQYLLKYAKKNKIDT
jgi:glutaredoxin